MPAFSLIRGTSDRLTELNLVVPEGLQVYEVDTGKVKVGDGVTAWNDLEYFLPESEIRAIIQQTIADLDLGSGTGDGATVTPAIVNDAMMLHINNYNPHPIYDDGPSLLLLYQNAKV